ncbi:MAG: hypothetical protein ACLTU1_14910, partial [Blautia wexlerae]
SDQRKTPQWQTGLCPNKKERGKIEFSIFPLFFLFIFSFLWNRYHFYCRQIYDTLLSANIVNVHSVLSNLAKIPDCLRQWNFGLYVSGFWHIHAKTPRGIVVCEQ